jgi:streptogramin lyase
MASYLVVSIGHVARAAPTAITEFSASLSGWPQTITPGPDGNVWFNVFDDNARAIGRITSEGTITEFTAGLEGIPDRLVSAPDGNLWFGVSNPPAIGRITPQGAITLQTGLRVNTAPKLILGPEGNFWFVSTPGVRPGVGRVTPSGTISQFDLPNYPMESSVGQTETSGSPTEKARARRSAES